MQIAVLEEQKNEAVENETIEKVEDEDKPVDTDLSTKGEVLDEKPDINDIPMEESQVTMSFLFCFIAFHAYD